MTDENREAKTETALVVADDRPVTLMRPVVSPDDLIRHHQEIMELTERALKKGTDYGVIPGTGSKPTLLKPGAERIAIAFGVVPSYTVIESEIDHDRPVEWLKRKKRWKNRKFDGWDEIEGTSRGLYRYVMRCDLRERSTDRLVASGIGTCSTMESKYIDRPRECENTTAKMAQKRALVAAVLNAFGLSGMFTQDVEDMDGGPQQRQDPPTPRGRPKRSLMADMWADASKIGVDADTWKTWLKELEITRDARTQTEVRIKALAEKIAGWSLPDETAPKDKQALAALKDALDENDLISGPDGFVGACNYLLSFLDGDQGIESEDQITASVIQRVYTGLDLWNEQQSDE